MTPKIVHDHVATGMTSGLNGCCTVMWKANGKPTTSLLSQDSPF